MTGGYDLKPYTSKAKKAIDLAARISKKMNYSYVGTEHILAGLIKEGTGVAAEVLTACNVEYDKLISMIEDLISPGDNIEVMDRDGYSPRTQRVLEYRTLADGYSTAGRLCSCKTFKHHGC